MLHDEAAFAKVERLLEENGAFDRAEPPNGEVWARMMISLCEIPGDIEVEPGVETHAFEATFDFCDVAVGIALDPVRREAKSGIWLTPQREDAVPPDEGWIELFIQKLLTNIAPDGSYGVPICTFLVDEGDITVVPAGEDEL